MFHPWVHYVITLIHISAALFWLGWIVFIFLLLVPSLKERIPERVQDVLSAVKSRVRRVVFWLIWIIIATGLYNMEYRGLTHPEILFDTKMGHLFLVKLGAALLTFAIYFSAPFLTTMASQSSGEETCESHGDLGIKIGVLLHVIVVLSMITAALIGVSVGG